MGVYSSPTNNTSHQSVAVNTTQNEKPKETETSNNENKEVQSVPKQDENKTNDTKPVATSSQNVNTDTYKVENKKEYTVYVAPTGKKYHLKDCRTLSRSKTLTPLSKSEAISRGYDACKVCNP